MFFQRLLLSGVSTVILAVSVNSFVSTNLSVALRRSFNGASVNVFAVSPVDSLAGKEFQLDELEDKEGSETELWLNADGTITLGKTNGPIVKESKGDWRIIETDLEPFKMSLTRVYSTGSRSGPNQVGEFSYEVTREFRGNMEMVGESVTVSGKTYGLDERDQIECEVGFFSLIDANEGIEGDT